MAKQSEQDQARRMSKGQCPVHGVFLAQVESHGKYVMARCARRDCPIVVRRRRHSDGPWQVGLRKGTKYRLLFNGVVAVP